METSFNPLQVQTKPICKCSRKYGCSSFNPLQVQTKQYSWQTRFQMHQKGFNPLQVQTKPIRNCDATLVSDNRFNPLQVQTKLDISFVRHLFTNEFQSPIGTNKTLLCVLYIIQIHNSFNPLQVQTKPFYKAIQFVHLQVSIPYRYKQNGRLCP